MQFKHKYNKRLMDHIADLRRLRNVKYVTEHYLLFKNRMDLFVKIPLIQGSNDLCLRSPEIGLKKMTCAKFG